MMSSEASENIFYWETTQKAVKDQQRPEMASEVKHSVDWITLHFICSPHEMIYLFA